MLDFGFYNMDCMDGMKEFPDKFFDLAIVDPPYGINVGQASMGVGVASLRTATAQPSGGGVQKNRRLEAVRQESKSGEALHRPQNL